MIEKNNKLGSIYKVSYNPDISTHLWKDLIEKEMVNPSLSSSDTKIFSIDFLLDYLEGKEKYADDESLLKGLMELGVDYIEI